MTKRTSSRRDFLKGRSAADAMADSIERALPDELPRGGPSRDSGQSYLIRISRPAMACEFEIRLNAGQYEHGTQTALEALDLVDALEDQMSIFRPDSEVSRINRTAAAGLVEVEPRLFELLQLALRIHGETDGTFDVTSAGLSEAWGFARREGAVPDEEQLAEALRHVGSHLVQLDPERRTVRFLQEGVQLNLGGIGKGYALDRCAEKLLAAGVNDFLIHGGNSSVLARGSQMSIEDGSTRDAGRGWEVGVRHPIRPDRRLSEMQLCDRSLATSGSWAQSFVYQGRRYGHVLDPRTGRPAEGILSATAVAPSAAEADALSTAFYVMGSAAASDFCGRRPAVSAILACPVRHSGGVEVHTAGLAD